MFVPLVGQVTLLPKLDVSLAAAWCKWIDATLASIQTSEAGSLLAIFVSPHGKAQNIIVEAKVNIAIRKLAF
jgi:hypothetical protein